MTHEQILTAVTESPTLLAMLPDYEAIASALSLGKTTLAEVWITERTILSRLGAKDGGKFIKALRAFALTALPAQHPLFDYHDGIQIAIDWLRTDQGLNIGDPESQNMLDALVQVGVIDADHAALVKAIGQVPVSIPSYEVERALRSLTSVVE